MIQHIGRISEIILIDVKYIVLLDVMFHLLQGGKQNLFALISINIIHIYINSTCPSCRTVRE